MKPNKIEVDYFLGLLLGFVLVLLTIFLRFITEKEITEFGTFSLMFFVFGTVSVLFLIRAITIKHEQVKA